MSSGFCAGSGAAQFARQKGPTTHRRIRGAGTVALNAGDAAEFDPGFITRAVQAEVFPYTTNYFRTGDGLAAALERLDTLWAVIRSAGQSSAAHMVKAREAAAMLATSRWMYRSALARTESRGMHKREDRPALDPSQRHHIVSGGLDEIQIAVRSAAPHPLQELAA